MKLQDSLKIALEGLLDEISSIPDIHESVFLEMLQVNVNICRYLVVKMTKGIYYQPKIAYYTAIPDSCNPLQ